LACVQTSREAGSTCSTVQKRGRRPHIRCRYGSEHPAEAASRAAAIFARMNQGVQGGRQDDRGTETTTRRIVANRPKRHHRLREQLLARPRAQGRSAACYRNVLFNVPGLLHGYIVVGAGSSRHAAMNSHRRRFSRRCGTKDTAAVTMYIADSRQQTVLKHLFGMADVMRGVCRDVGGSVYATGKSRS
jgi:hypothetical protein